MAQIDKPFRRERPAETPPTVRHEEDFRGELRRGRLAYVEGEQLSASAGPREPGERKARAGGQGRRHIKPRPEIEPAARPHEQTGLRPYWLEIATETETARL